MIITEEPIKWITECMRKLDLTEMTRNKLIKEMWNLSANEIEDFVWELFVLLAIFATH